MLDYLMIYNLDRAPVENLIPIMLILYDDT